MQPNNNLYNHKVVIFLHKVVFEQPLGCWLAWGKNVKIQQQTAKNGRKTVKKQSLICLLAFVAASAAAVTCRDFATQGDAQRYHDAHGGNTRMDGDKDGEACECLPGGSAYGNPKCNRKR